MPRRPRPSHDEIVGRARSFLAAALLAAWAASTPGCADAAPATPEPVALAAPHGGAVEPLADASPPPPAARPASAAIAPPHTSRPTRVAVLNFGAPRAWQGEIDDLLGLQVNAKSWAEAIPLLKQDNVDVVVVRMNCSGGFPAEIQPLHRVLIEQYRPAFRTVAWVETSLNEAAMVALASPEIYFMRNGSVGRVVGWPARTSDFRDLAHVQIPDHIARANGRDPLLVRAMQVMQPLSATIDPSGQVRYFPDLTGKIIVNPADRVLVLTSDLAVQIKFAQGVADTKEELMKAMGIDEYAWAGEAAADFIDANMREADRNVKRFDTLEDIYIMAIEDAAHLSGEANRDLRRQQAGRAGRALAEMRKSISANPMFELALDRGREWLEQQDQIVDELQK